VRVLLDYRPALRARTGVGEYVHELLAALDRRSQPGDELHLFTASFRDRLEPSVRAELSHVTPHDLAVPGRLLHWSWNRLEMPAIERLTGVSADVVHAANPLLIPARRAAQTVTIHDLDFLDHPADSRAEIRRDYPRLARDHAHRAHAVLTSSQTTADAIVRRLGVPAERITVCPAGAPRWTMGPRRQPRAADGYILFAGTLSPRKNVGTLLDAYETLASRWADAPRLRLAGASTRGAPAWLERIRRPPLSGRTDYVGYVPDAERRALFEGASVVVMPSWHEGFGLPALEAMALGIPVVASNRGSLPEVLGGAGLLFDPASPDALADALERLLTDSSVASACIAAGLARSVSWTWAAAAERVWAMFAAAATRRER
jgi:glycosyltransferase involved in cell wall biosynthesis